MKLLTTLRRALAAEADPARAPQQQAYMKSVMPYHGCSSTVSRGVFKRIFADVALPDAATWRALVLELWHRARFREERYAAIWLTGDERARAFQTPDALSLYEELIVTGAWWDYVDELASHRVGGLLRLHPAPIKKAMRAWSRSDDLWKRRTAIICQLGSKEETDLDLLYECIERAIDSKEFFLRKAIGWALRQYAWTDPAEVVRWVTANESRLSPLSRREALINVEGRRARKTGAKKKA